MNKKLYLFLFLLVICVGSAYSQVSFSNTGRDISYSSPKKYKIGGITISGVEFLDENVLKMLSGLRVGQVVEVPGEEITKAVKNLWKQGLFEDVSITVTSIVDDQIFLDIYLAERPRLSKFAFKGISKSAKKESDILWNFTKFLINRDGTVIKRFAPVAEPASFEKDIEELL